VTNFSSAAKAALDENSQNNSEKRLRLNSNAAFLIFIESVI
jgi:hypothetical protein